MYFLVGLNLVQLSLREGTTGVNNCCRRLHYYLGCALCSVVQLRDTSFLCLSDIES